jgi:hypothetical protein
VAGGRGWNGVGPALDVSSPQDQSRMSAVTRVCDHAVPLFRLSTFSTRINASPSVFAAVVAFSPAADLSRSYLLGGVGDHSAEVWRRLTSEAHRHFTLARSCSS